MTDSERHSLLLLVIVLVVATYAKYILKYSLKEFLAFLLEEFRLLLSIDVKAGAINAFGVVVSSIFLIANFVVPKFDKLLSVGGIVPASGNTTVSSFAAAGFVVIASFVCVHLLARSK